MKIAITGASGFLGTQLVNGLADSQLYLLGRSLKRLEDRFGNRENIVLIETDYSLQSLEKSLLPANAVVHLAGVRFRKDLISFSDYLDNIRISENLFKTCLALELRNVVFASTISLYSEDANKIPFREDDVVFPKNLYAISKLVIEKLGNLYDLNLKCLRLAQLVGIGERKGFMLKTWILNAIRKEPLLLFGEGRGRRDYLDVKDAVSAINAALSKPGARGIFNVGSGTSTSHRQLAEAIKSTLGENQIQVVTDNTKPEDTSQSLMDSNKAKNILGWRPKYSLEETLIEMREDIKNPQAENFLQ